MSVAACTASESGAEPTDQPDPEAPVHIESEPSRTPTDTAGPEYFFAVLGQAGIEHCVEGMGVEPSWLRVHPTLGFVAAGGPGLASLEQLEALYDQPVLARGLVSPAPITPPLEVEFSPCMPMQRRSDWVNTPRGIRVRRSEEPRPDYFHTTSVRRLDELRVEREGEQLVVSFLNPLPFALDGLTLRMHYEGCYGKPGTSTRESEMATLGPGEVFSHRFELFDAAKGGVPRKGGPSARRHRAADLSFSLGPQAGPGGAAVHTDLAVSLRSYGIEFDCS